MTGPLKRVLLVDDDSVTNLTHERKLRRSGMAEDVDVVTDGEAALAYLQTCIERGTPLPELILLDINMPRMNGFEFLECYAAFPEDIRARQRIFMVSTSTLCSDRGRAEESGCVAGYATKPLGDEDLERIMASCQSAAVRGKRGFSGEPSVV